MKGERMEFNPDRMVGHKIRMVHNSIDKFFDRHHKEETKKIPRGQVMIIHYLMDHPDEEVYQKDLEKFFSISGATATNMIKGLEKSELVERIPNEKDARLKRIVLTEKAVVREQRIRKFVNIFEFCFFCSCSTCQPAVFTFATEYSISAGYHLAVNIWFCTMNFAYIFNISRTCSCIYLPCAVSTSDNCLCD